MGVRTEDLFLQCPPCYLAGVGCVPIQILSRDRCFYKSLSFQLLLPAPYCPSPGLEFVRCPLKLSPRICTIPQVLIPCSLFKIPFYQTLLKLYLFECAICLLSFGHLPPTQCVPPHTRTQPHFTKMGWSMLLRHSVLHTLFFSSHLNGYLGNSIVLHISNKAMNILMYMFGQIFARLFYGKFLTREFPCQSLCVIFKFDRCCYFFLLLDGCTHLAPTIRTNIFVSCTC